MCGQCCRALSLDQSPEELRALAERESARLARPTRHRDDIERLLRDVAFILEHFEPIRREEAVAINAGLADVGDRWFYRCDALTPDGACSRHAERPFVCEGYPWYHGSPDPALLVYRPCGYESDVGPEATLDIDAVELVAARWT